MKPEQAGPEDRDEIVALLRSKVYPVSHLEGVGAEQRKALDLEALEAQWQTVFAQPLFELWVVRATEGCQAFVLALFQQVEHATGQLEAIMVEHAGALQAYPVLITRLVESARKRGDSFFAWRLYPHELALRDLLVQAGFAPEFSRVVRSTRASQADPVSGSLEIRRACSRDRAFLARLHLDCSPFYQSSNRAGAEWGALDALGNYLSLELEEQSITLGWVAWEQQQPIGYVLVKRDFLLEASQGRAAYLYDIAVARSHWGKEAATLLHEHAVHELARLGYPTLVGDISWHNHRALGMALGKLNYQVEWERWGVNL